MFGSWGGGEFAEPRGEVGSEHDEGQDGRLDLP
jgi:hypothetical protein